MPDKAVLDRLQGAPEVQAFMNKYPGALKTVDRGGPFAADYRVEKGDPSGNDSDSYRYFRLRVFIDSAANPQPMFVECSGGPRISDNMINHIETEDCLDGTST